MTDKKLEANRRNARKSRGPKTEEGKRNSSKNAIRHGILANSILVEGESRERFVVFLNALVEEYAPQNVREQLLVEKIAVAQWRLRRIWSVQSAGINDEIRKLPDSLKDADPPLRVLAAMRAMSENSRGGIDPLTYYEHRFDILQHRAAASLERLQRSRLAGDKRSHDVVENKESAPENDPTQTPCDPK